MTPIDGVTKSKVATPGAKISEVEGIGKYRGLVWKNRSIKNAGEVAEASNYRGVSVQRNIPVTLVMSTDIQFFG